MFSEVTDTERAPGDSDGALSLAEKLTLQFYAWERRGRGWQRWPFPVPLEPPFQPFLGHFVPSAPRPLDDGRKPTWVSALVDRITGRNDSGTVDDIAFDPTEELVPDYFEDTAPLVELVVSLAPDQRVGVHEAEGFLLALSGCRFPVAFEVVATIDSLMIQLTCREPDRGIVWSQIAAYFPDAVVREESARLAGLWDQSSSGKAVIVEFGLSREFMLPLRAVRQTHALDPDPLVPIVGALSDLHEGEVGVFQVLFEPSRAPWAESAIRAVMDGDDGPFFVDAPGMVKETAEKMSHPLYAAIVRAGVKSSREGRTWDVLRGLVGALAQFGRPPGNELIPLAQDDEPWVLEEDLVARRTHRSGMLLSSEELLSLVHLPSVSVRSPKLRVAERKTKAAPEIALGHPLILGQNTHRGQTITVSLGLPERLRHMHVIGASGTGKSTLLLNLILQDVEQGNGLALLDPHGDLVNDVLGRIPRKRFKDVVLLDPSDESYPVGFNVLSARSALEKNLLASDLVAIFRRLSTSWGDQMNSVFANAIQAILESDRGGTLADLRRFLIEPDFRREFLETVQDLDVVYYWTKEFSYLVGRQPQGPILTRLDAFLRPKPIRYMVAQRENRLDFRGMLDEGKIFLAKLSQGGIGEENAALLGSLLVSKLHQVASSRQDVSVEKRRAFFLYIDEFQHFVTPSMATLLSGARKYRLGLILAHQELRQLQAKDPEVLSSVLSNACTRVCFRVGEQDARVLESGFASFDAQDLSNLGVGEAICRIDRIENDFNITTARSPDVNAQVARRRRDRAVAQSRAHFGRPLDEVRRELDRERSSEAEPRSSRAEVKPSGAAKREVHGARRTEGSKPAPPAEPVEAPAVAPREKVPAPVVAVPSHGRGGPQHKYLQELIKRWGEANGWRATIERPVLDGLGSIDVALEKGDISIACEISVTTPAEYEIGNVQKCLAAGFDNVILVGTNVKGLKVVKELVLAQLSHVEAGRIRVLNTEQLFAYLIELQAESVGKEAIVNGYKVNVKYRSAATDESRKLAISRVVVQALKRLKRVGK